MKRYKSEIEIINRALEVLAKSHTAAERYKPRTDLLNERKERAIQNTFRMGIIGVTSSGKSTLINSLLDEDLLPSAVRPTSSQLVSCCKGDTRQGVIHFTNKEAKIINSKNLTPQIIRRYGEEESNPHNREEVKQIEIYSPKFPFDKKLTLVDSPGLDAYGFAGHEQLTLNTLLPSIDFCLFITTCKTNSDSKTKAILETIAHYDKPVIIIQNMIDSIRPSLDIDGNVRKTESEVAEEHQWRVQKIVNASKIQSDTAIVQYSAIWAREAQMQNDESLLEKSGYNRLVSTIKETFNRILPTAENKRLVFLKQELEKIIDEAEKDGSAAMYPLGKFEYEEVIECIYEDADRRTKRIHEILGTLKEVEKFYFEKRSITKSDIDSVKEKCEECTGDIGKIQLEVYNNINRLCNKLNIPTTQLFNEQSHFPAMAAPSLETKEEVKTTKHKKEGIGNKIKRAVGRGINIFRKNEVEWGYEIEQKVTIKINTQASKKNIIDYLQGAYRTYSRIIENWAAKVEKGILRLEVEINKYRAEFNARKEKALNAVEYREIADRLKEIVRDIQLVNITEPTPHQYKKHGEQMSRQEISKLSYDITRLAYGVNSRIHKLIFENLFSENGKTENIIIGWDYFCIQDFLKRSLGRSTDLTTKNATGMQTESFTIGKQEYRVYYDITDAESIPHKSSCGSNIFILISALQYGHALSQLAKCNINKLIQKFDTLYIVLQDFQEIINAQIINEALASLWDIKAELHLMSHPTFMILHENPIYNLAALETQRIKRQSMNFVQNDELTLLNSLQNSSLGCLCTLPSDSKNTMSIIQSLK